MVLNGQQSAAAAGFRTGSTPQVGAIISWNDGGYGHVAVVTAVESPLLLKGFSSVLHRTKPFSLTLIRLLL